MKSVTLFMALTTSPRLQGGGESGAEPALPMSLREISRSWNDTQSLFPTSWLLISLGSAMAIIAVAVWLKKRRQRIENPSAADVWRSFAERLELGFWDRRLLERISRQQSLPSPLTLFVCPTTFDHHAAAYAQQLREGRRQELARHLQSLRQRLFETAP
ncbi:MAG: hypothetical protein ACOC1G_05410 [Phycisphaeraceae bacterium]